MPTSSPSLRRFCLEMLAWCFVIIVWIASSSSVVLAQATGEVELHIEEEESGEPLVARVKLRGPNGKELRIRGALFQNGWNLVERPMKHDGRPGEYQYEVTHGPELARGVGGFVLDKKSEAIDVIRLPRHCDLNLEGWHGGDLLNHVTPDDAQRWLVAEQLKMTTVIRTDLAEPKAKDQPPANPGNRIVDETHRWIDEGSYLDARANGGLTLHHWMPEQEVPQWVPSSKLLVMAKQNAKTFAEIQRLWARDVPIWLASGKIDGVQLLSDHLTIEGEGAARVTNPPGIDAAMYRGARGPGRMVESIYWRLLDCGLRIPPTAGSGFGKNPSPLGYNRVYVMTGKPDSANWWQSLRDGQSFVTNGPLLRASVNESLPGTIFRSSGQQAIELDIDLKLTVADPVEYLDVIFNGQTLYQARLDEYARLGGKIPPLSIKESGWLVIRVVTERDFTYRIASTAPFYFEFNGQPRVSRKAAEFFQQWLEKTEQQVASESEQSRTAAQPFIDAAKKFWSSKVKNSTAP